MGDVGHHATVDLHLDFVGFVDSELLFDVFVLEIHASHVALRDDISPENEGGGGDDGGSHEEGAEQTAETHARAFHGDDFGAVGQLCGEENHGNEDKQRREHVREVGDEVRIVVEHHFVPARSAVGELVNLLVEVKDDGNRDDECQQKHIGAEKTHENVAVDALETDET